MWRRCRVSSVTGASNWYWLPVGQGLLSLKQVRVEGECFYFFCFFTFTPVSLSSLSLSFISTTISSFPFSGRRHKMTHKGWRVVKPKHNKSINQSINSTVTSIFPYQGSPKWRTATAFISNRCRSGNSIRTLIWDFAPPEACNSTNGSMTLETTYRRKVPCHWLAGFSSDWH